LFLLVINNSGTFSLHDFFLMFQCTDFFMMALSQVVDFASQSFGLEGRLGSFFFGIGEGDLGVLNVLVRRRGVRVPFLRAGREGLSKLLKVVR
jgi:hypothetical protein